MPRKADTRTYDELLDSASDKLVDLFNLFVDEKESLSEIDSADLVRIGLEVKQVKKDLTALEKIMDNTLKQRVLDSEKIKNESEV